MIMNKKKKLRLKIKKPNSNHINLLEYSKMYNDYIEFKNKEKNCFLVLNDIFVSSVYYFILNIATADNQHYRFLQIMLKSKGYILEKEKEPEITKKSYENYIMKFLKNLNIGKYK